MAEHPLRKITTAFESLADVVENSSSDIEVGPFSEACAHVALLFGCLNNTFKFAEIDYIEKVNDIKEASKSISTLKEMIELDIKNNCVKQGGSHTRNLLTIKRGLNYVKKLFEEILKTEGNSMIEPALVAYREVIAQYHGTTARKVVGAGMYALPSKSQVLKKMNEDEASLTTQMHSYIRSSGPVIKYVEELFNSKQLGLDW